MTPPPAAARTDPRPTAPGPAPRPPGKNAPRRGAAQAPARRRRRARLPKPASAARAVLAAGAGVLLYAAFPPAGAAWAAPLAVTVLTLLVRGRRLRAAYGLAWLFGLGFFLPLLRFVDYVGMDALIVLAAAEAAILALVGPATTLVLRMPRAVSWLAVACVWIGDEALRGRAPFGGFPWGRLAFSQSDTVFTPLAAIGGAPLLTFVVAATGALGATLLGSLAVAGQSAAARRFAVPALPGPAAPGRPGRLLALGAALPAAAIAAFALVPLAVALPTAAEDGTLRVAAIQGNVPADGGFTALGERMQVTTNHLNETLALARQIAAGETEKPGLVVWPENSSDIDPFLNADDAALLTRAAQAVGSDVLVGAVLDGPGAGHVRNAGLVWTATGYGGQMYVKHRPVPFAEYLPGRAVLQKMIKRFAEEMPNDFVHGTGPAVVTAGGTTVGDVICFEVAYDGNVRDSVEQGARILVVQTNNASFGRKGESQQQLAMTRIRAIEHGRATIQVSTSGQSAIITPDGTILGQTGLYEAGALSAALPLRTSRTVADRAGAIPEAVATALGVAAIMGGTALGRRRPHTDGAAHPGGGAACPDQSGTPRDDDAPREHRPDDGRGQERNGVDAQRVVVCVPTYNERENITITARRLRDANPTVDLLVIDDNSPDGTGEIAAELAREDPHIHVLRRAGKSGLGSAYVAGFSWALRHGYDVIVEMDADGSHQPEELPRLLSRLQTADLVIGSRWVKGGKVRNWPKARLFLSRGANLYVRAALGIPVRDATAGYRAYRADVLRARDLDKIQSQGYCFQVDLAWTAWRGGFHVAEVPITFVERERGASKMSRSIIIEAFWRTALWAVTSGRRGPAAVRPAPAPALAVPAPATETACLPGSTGTGGASSGSAPPPPAAPTLTKTPTASTNGTATVEPPVQQRTGSDA